jgi:hypothetical protein
MSANFTQISGPGGRTQSFAASTAIQTYIWNPASLKGTLPGGDFIYTSRARGRVVGQLTRNAGAGSNNTPNVQQIMQSLGFCRMQSQFLGEIMPKSLNTIPLVMNHDAWFMNGFQPPQRARGQMSGSSGDAKNVEIEFELPIEADMLARPQDTCFWQPFLEGGIIEIDLQPSNALSPTGWTMTGTWTMSLVLDWYPDKQAMIHAPMQARLYRVTTQGPEYTLKSVGSSQGLDGVVMGARQAVLSWLAKGYSASNNFYDNGFYAAFGGGGLQFGAANINRMDVPWRDQVSVDEVSAWVGSFLADVGPTRYRPNLSASSAAPLQITQNDMQGWPFCEDGTLTNAAQSYINDQLDFFPLVWLGKGAKISDMQKVDGDLSFTASLGTPPSQNILHLFRSLEICGFTAAKVLDLMDRMGLPHKSRGGQYDYVPKYAGSKRADDTTQWGMPLKIVKAA